LTVTAEISGRGPRHGWAIWIALALSLTLNVFVAGGLFWSMMARPLGPEAPADRLVAAARTLDLTPDQQAALRQFARTSRELRRTLADTNAPIFRQVWTEVVKAQPDPAAISKLMDTAADNRRAFQGKMTANLTTFVATLTPEQRQRFAELAMRRPGAQHPPPP
jgi:uncharacterized membrane protein